MKNIYTHSPLLYLNMPLDQVPRNPRSRFSDSGDRRRFVPVYVHSVLTLSTKTGLAFVSLQVCATQLENGFSVCSMKNRYCFPLPVGLF